MTRENLPHRRKTETFKFWCRGIEFVASVGHYVDGRPAELFLNASKKITTDADHDARDVAILVSFALQHGATLEELAKAMTRDAVGDPQGMAGHALDAVLAELAEG